MKRSLLSTLGGLSRLLARTPLRRLAVAEQVQFRVVEWLDPSDEFEVGSFRIRVDPRDRRMRKTLRLYGGYERYEVDLLRSLVSPGDVVVDAGAHVGIHTLWASRSAGPSGRVIAFEPDPDNRRLLERNLETNGVENVEVVAAALSDRTGERRLYQNPTDRANLSLRNPREFVPRTPGELLREIERGDVRNLLWRRDAP